MLKPYFGSLEEDHKEQLIGMHREKELHQLCISTFPPEIEAQISVSDMGFTLIRAFIYLKHDAKEEDTKSAVRWLAKLYGKTKRDFREEQGTFLWTSHHDKEDKDGKYRELIFIENAHKQECAIRKVKKTVEVFEADCKQKAAVGKEVTASTPF